MSEQSTTGAGVNCSTLLTILFIGLKLTGYIDWSWWWVLAPLWLPIAVAVVVWLVCWTLIRILDARKGC